MLIFADVKTIMSNAGSALMGIGNGTGEDRAATAARTAIASPLLEVSVEGAKGVLFNIIGGKDLTMREVNDAAEIITQSADADANIIFGATIDESLTDQIKITLIATGFDEARSRLQHLAGRPLESAPKHISPQDDRKPKKLPSVQLDEKPIKEPEDDQISEENSELDIPAFLRQGH